MSNIQASELIVNGIKYVPADSIKAAPVVTGTKAIVVVDRGWVFAGNVKRENGRILITNALHVFSWSSGFAMLVNDPKKAKADLRKLNDIDIPMQSEVYTVPVVDTWGV